MRQFDYPYVRDELVIDAEVQEFCDGFVGGGPVFLIGRRVTHAVTLVLRTRPIVIVADVYDGSGGMIDASGYWGGGGAQGANGHGVGASGEFGGVGGHGGPGGSVTLYCRQTVNAHVSVAGGGGGVGGNGGNGTDGTQTTFSEGHWEYIDHTPEDPTDPDEPVWVDGEVFPGVTGGRGGRGGPGGNGGNGGAISFTSIVDETPPWLEAPGGPGREGGWGGTGGVFAVAEEDGGNTAPSGAEGYRGADGTIAYATVTEAEFVAGLRPVLGSYADEWALFRLAVGEWRYHQHDEPGQPSATELAATEFRRTLELQDNADALRLQQQLESGVNALGLDPRLDVVPVIDQYISAYTGFGALTLSFVTSGIDEIMNSLMLHNLSLFAEGMRLQAVAARDDATDQLGYAATEQQFADDEIGYARQRLDQASADITAEMARMQQASMEEPGFPIGTVAEVALAVVGVIAAVPTAGTSLVSLVPTVATLASTVLQEAGPIANAVLHGTDADVSDIEHAYAKIGKEAPAAVVAGAKSVINFVSVVERLSARTTPDNARYVALVRRGVELTHELLLAQRRASLAQQRVDIVQRQRTRSQAAVDAATSVRDAPAADADTLKKAGLVTLNTARAAAASLLGFAFRAQRAVEIYTLKDETARLHLGTGLLRPDFVREYETEQRHSDAAFVGAVAASWNGLLKPVDLQTDYLSYFDDAPDNDQLRLGFAGDGPEAATLRATGRLAFRVDVDDLPDGRFDAKVIGARVALVGATHPNGQISVQLHHGGRHEQRRPDGTVTVQLLTPRTVTCQTGLTPLAGDTGFVLGSPLADHTDFRLWGRGLCGEWELRIPGDQQQGLDLGGLAAVQVWFGYRFLG